MSGMTEDAALAEKKLEPWMIIASVLTIPAVVIEANDFPSPWPATGVALSAVIWIAFLFEFCVMMRVVPSRREWIDTHKLETFLVVVSFPILPTGLGALRLVRLIRISRLGRLVKVARHGLSLRGLPYIAMMTAILVVAAGSAFTAIEKGQGFSQWDGLWWSATTVTTVGYGDISPHTTGGRFVALFVMFLGIGFVAVLTAAIAQRFVQHELDERQAADPTAERAAILNEVQKLRERIEQLDARLKLDDGSVTVAERPSDGSKEMV